MSFRRTRATKLNPISKRKKETNKIQTNKPPVQAVLFHRSGNHASKSARFVLHSILLTLPLLSVLLRFLNGRCFLLCRQCRGVSGLRCVDVRAWGCSFGSTWVLGIELGSLCLCSKQFAFSPFLPFKVCTQVILFTLPALQSLLSFKKD